MTEEQRKGVKFKGMSRRVSNDEVFATLHMGDSTPSDYFLLQEFGSTTLGFWNPDARVMDLIIEDEDVAHACEHQ